MQSNYSYYRQNCTTLQENSLTICIKSHRYVLTQVTPATLFHMKDLNAPQIKKDHFSSLKMENMRNE